MQNFKLEELLGYPLAEVDDMIENMGNHVSVVSIPKKSGGVRRITIPDEKLKSMQTNVLKNVLYRYSVHSAAHGFVVGKSTVTGARLHCFQRSVFGADIKSFFDNITDRHIKNALFGNANMCEICSRKGQGCNPSLYKAVETDEQIRSGVLSAGVRPCDEILSIYDPDYIKSTGYQSLMTRVVGLTIYQNRAPQGFPTSPAVGNMVLKGFDKWMSEFASSLRLVYTRYADDITVSSSSMPPRLLAETIIKPVRNKLFGFGFMLNKKKTRCIGAGRKQTVTGIVVNSKCSIGRDARRLLRAKVHHVVTGRVNPSNEELMVLKGECAYLKMVSPEHGVYLDKISRYMTARKYRA